jgi:hypothetical protein
LLGLLGAVSALAQKTTNFTFDYGLTGSAGSLGKATLVIHSVVQLGTNGPLSPAQAIAGLYFNAIDSITINFTWNNATSTPLPKALTGGTITGGTGAYAGANGSLDFIVEASGAKGGSGSVTVGGKTTLLNLTGFYGDECLPGDCQRDFREGAVTGSTSLGNVTGTFKVENTYHDLFNPSAPNRA